jgi:MFS family permease
MSEETTKPDEKKFSPGMKTFLTIWIGQFISLMGSGLTSFALGLWVYEHTASVTQFTLTIVFAGLPGILIGPIAGALVDRWDRRWVLFWCNIGPAATVAIYSWLFAHNQLQVWHVYIGVVFNAILATFQWPAYIAAITMLVQPKDYVRVNGLLEFGGAATGIAGPMLGGLLLYAVGVPKILLIDLVTFLVSAFILLFVRIPKPEQSEEGKKGKGSIWKEAAFGWVYIKERPGLLHLLLLFAVLNFFMSMCGVAVIPMARGFANSAVVGILMSLVGVASLVGGMLMTWTGGFKKRIHGVLLGWAAMTICFIVVGLRPTPWVVGTGIFLWYLALPLMNTSSQAIWQAKTPRDIMGRVFSVRRMLAQFTVPLGDFTAGPLADKIFNPAMAIGGALSSSAGKVIGVGPGRGIALMLITFAIVPVIVAEEVQEPVREEHRELVEQ